MGFKIGDRVKVLECAGEYVGSVGVVTMLRDPRLDSGGFDCEVDFPDDEGVLFRSAELSLHGRGPKPLTLNGGRPRFTVTAGLTVRKPPRHWTNDMWLLRAPGRER